jgi:flagellar biosynthesis/type III secretory pathway protein FliH
MTRGDRQTTFKLLYIVSAAILGESTARRIFHVESIIQDPNVQALISEWAEQGHAKGLEQGHAKGLEQGRAKGLEQGRVQAARQMLLDVLSARSFTVTRAVRARIKAESDIARLGSWHRAAVTASSIRDVFRAR